MASGLAVSLQLMSLLVQRPVDTRRSADKLEDGDVEAGMAEIRLLDSMRPQIQQRPASSQKKEATVLIKVSLFKASLHGSHIKYSFSFKWLLFNAAGFVHKVPNE